MNKKFQYSKLIEIEDYENKDLIPILEELAYEDKIKFGLKNVEVIPDSKQWESAMAIKSFDDFGLIKEGNTFAGIGAGIEINTFYLASKGCICFPVDKYLSKTPWSDVAPIGMMIDPKRFTNIKTNENNIIPVHSDARMLKLPSNFFNGVYSAGSIEHFGSLKKVSLAMKEIYRILKPGGYASITTEFKLEGPVDKQWFDDSVILFTNDLIKRHIIEPSNLKLIGEINKDVSEKTYATRKELNDFLDSNSKMISIEDKRAVFPNFVLHHEGFLFCSAHIFLQKPLNSKAGPLEDKSQLINEMEESYTSDINALKFIETVSMKNEPIPNKVNLLTKLYDRFKGLIN